MIARMASRRLLLCGIAMCVSGHSGATSARDILGLQDGGIIDLIEAWVGANAEGRALAILFTQVGCPSCRTLMQAYRTDPDLIHLSEGRFRWIELNLFGDRMVQDFDGTLLPERRMAQRWRVRYAPTILFVPSGPAPQRGAHEAEAVRMQGLPNKSLYRSMLTYVADGHHRAGIDFVDWLRTRHGRPDGE